MKTTEMFVELVVIGTGAFIWLLLMILTIFGYNWIPFDKPIFSPLILLFIVLIYVFGIIVDRLADCIFKNWEEKIREIIMPDKDHRQIRAIVYKESSLLKEWSQYGRTRLRICRGWALNMVIIFITSNLFIWIRWPSESYKLEICIFLMLFNLLIFIALIFSWYKIIHNEFTVLNSEFVACANLSLRR